MSQWLVRLLALVLAAELLRQLILLLEGMRMRNRLARRPDTDDRRQAAWRAWRKHRGRQLGWLLLGLPVGLFLILIVVGEFG